MHLFFERIEPLGRHLGPILVQLPPSMKIDLDRLEAFLKMLPGKIGKSRLRIALEVRHESWLTDATRSLLDKHNISLVLHDWQVPTNRTNDVGGHALRNAKRLMELLGQRREPAPTRTTHHF